MSSTNEPIDTPSISLDESRVRSSRIPTLGSEEQNLVGSPAINPGSVSEATALPGLSAIIEVLQFSGLPGPAILVGPKTLLGQGAQFIVHKGEMISTGVGNSQSVLVAIKQPKFEYSDQRLKFTDPDAQQHLENISLEIKALATPSLRQHPNVVQLLSWGFEPYNVHGPIILAMELAYTDLQQLLSDKGRNIDCQHRYMLCTDVAHGLDAIHDCDLIHGDVKPANVLVFHRTDRFVAKLADFGLSVGSAEDLNRPVRLGGTPGWRAPEVERHQLLKPWQLLKTDSYSFGLVLWSTVLGSGQVPPPRGDDDVEWISSELEGAREKSEIGAHILYTLKYALSQLLDQDPDKRPLDLAPLLDSDMGTASRKIGKDLPNNQRGPQHVLGSGRHKSDHQAGYSWELRVPSSFNYALLPRYMDNVVSAPEVLLTLFLEATSSAVRPGYMNKPNLGKYSSLDILLVAAQQGSPAAQSAIPDVLEFYQETGSSQIQQSLVEYLTNAASTGSFRALEHLLRLDPVASTTAIHRFRSSGGYGKLYQMGSAAPRLHSIVSKGMVDELQSFLEVFPETDIEERTPNAETAIYLSCARGLWEMALALLDRGAKAYGGCTKYQVYCIHWIFAFEPSVQSIAVARLLQGGADIDSLIAQPVPFIHYPFSLPAGTPLHWAVVIRSYTAIKALLDNGAKVTVRDASDPYRYDERVRMLNSFGDILEDAYSYSEVGTKGLSPLDYAAMNFDPFIFEYLLSSKQGRHLDINDADEEGFTVIHRLSTSAVRRTTSGCSFSFLPFQGSPASLDDRLRRTVVAIKSLGGDFEKLTTPMACFSQKKQADGQELNFEKYTPLMLAALGGWPRVVKALLEAGASVATENEQGNTALHCIPEDRRATAETVRILVEAGAAPCHANRVGVTPLQRAAMRRSVEAMDVLLAHGADIEDTDNMPRSNLRGSSIFATLALKDYDADILDETYDEGVACLLEKYLLSCPDEEKRMRVVKRRTPGNPGGTLLHRFAECFMRHSTLVLIRCGADVNATTTRFEFIQSPDCGKSVKVPLQVTVFDAVVRAQAFHMKLMERDMRYTIPEYRHICMRADAVIMSLQSAGGVLSQGLQ